MISLHANNPGFLLQIWSRARDLLVRLRGRIEHGTKRLTVVQFPPCVLSPSKAVIALRVGFKG